MKTHTFMALSVMTIDIPPSTSGDFPIDRQAVAVGMFAAHKDDHGRWRFLNRAEAVGAGEGYETLLRWLAENLPPSATIIGWKIDSQLIPVLTSAASTAIPAVARDAMQRLADCLQCGPIDLALDLGGAAARPLIEVAADHHIGMPPVTDGERASDWAFAETDTLRAEAANVAQAIWRLFLRMSQPVGLEAEDATEDWIRRRRQIRAVSSVIRQ